MTVRILKNEYDYKLLKDDLIERIYSFDESDNLFDLVDAMRKATEILLKEDFPIKEWIIYTGTEKI